jgi:hypothetical protein
VMSGSLNGLYNSWLYLLLHYILKGSDDGV